MKRSHESLVSATGGVCGGDEQNFRQQSNSPGGRSVEPALPSSNASARKKVCSFFLMCLIFPKRKIIIKFEGLSLGVLYTVESDW